MKEMTRWSEKTTRKYLLEKAIELSDKTSKKAIEMKLGLA